MKIEFEELSWHFECTWRELRGIALESGSARLEKDFWSIERAPVEAARASASRCSIETFCSVEVDAPIFAGFSPQPVLFFSQDIAPTYRPICCVSLVRTNSQYGVVLCHWGNRHVAGVMLKSCHVSGNGYWLDVKRISKSSNPTFFQFGSKIQIHYT